MKTCISCSQPKPLTEFYKHPQMKDGHLGKCKECCKRDSVNNRNSKIKEYRKRDKDRNQLSKRVKMRLEYQATHKPLVNEIKKNWIKRNPEKRKAHLAVSNAIRAGRLSQLPCEVCRNPKTQAHHEDYSKPLEVTWLCTKHHRAAHAHSRRK